MTTTKEHAAMELVAVRLDEEADDLFWKLSNGMIPEGTDEAREVHEEAQAKRRCAEIIRHQIECEA